MNANSDADGPAGQGDELREVVMAYLEELDHQMSARDGGPWRVTRWDLVKVALVIEARYGTALTREAVVDIGLEELGYYSPREGGHSAYPSRRDCFPAEPRRPFRRRYVLNDPNR